MSEFVIPGYKLAVSEGRQEERGGDLQQTESQVMYRVDMQEVDSQHFHPASLPHHRPLYCHLAPHSLCYCGQKVS